MLFMDPQALMSFSKGSSLMPLTQASTLCVLDFTKHYRNSYTAVDTVSIEKNHPFQNTLLVDQQYLFSATYSIQVKDLMATI